MSKPLAFIPKELFRSISITGSKCFLNCLYCMGKYLSIMDHVYTPTEFYKWVSYLVKHKGIRGILVSGGFNRDGRLPIEPYLKVINDIKRDYGVVISVHIGLVDKELAKKIGSTGIDIVDYEFIVDPYVIRSIRNLDKKPGDYVKGLEFLEKYGPPYIAPHIPVGFRFGEIVSEYEAVDTVSMFDTYITTFIVFIPTRGTPMENYKPPKTSDIIELLRYAKRKLKTEIALGCMRPRIVKEDVDKYVIRESLIDRVVNPSKKLIKEYGLDIVKACCSIPRDYIQYFK